jgi:hypothetical protein
MEPHQALRVLPERALIVSRLTPRAIPMHLVYGWNSSCICPS